MVSQETLKGNKNGNLAAVGPQYGEYKQAAAQGALLQHFQEADTRAHLGVKHHIYC